LVFDRKIYIIPRAFSLLILRSVIVRFLGLSNKKQKNILLIFRLYKAN